jgi:hypothetical protein
MSAAQFESRVTTLNAAMSRRRRRVSGRPRAIECERLPDDTWRVGLERDGLRENLFYDVRLVTSDGSPNLVATRKRQCMLFVATAALACVFGVFTLVALVQHPAWHTVAGFSIGIGLVSMSMAGNRLAAGEPFRLASLLTNGDDRTARETRLRNRA